MRVRRRSVKLAARRDNHYNVRVLQPPSQPAHQPDDSAASTADQLREKLRVRAEELESAECHIARLETQILAWKDAKRAASDAKSRKKSGLWARLRKRPQLSKSPAPASALSYQAWLARHRATPADLARMRADARSSQHAPLVSIITPVFNTPASWLSDAVGSVRAQSYENWELILVDDGSTKEETLKVLSELPRADQRIRVYRMDENQGIAGASNRGLAEARGEWIAVLDHDDLLEPDALSCGAKTIQVHPDAVLIYSDEDKLAEHGFDLPILKPDWSPDFFLSYNYLCHFTLLRRTAVESAGGFRQGFDGAQDYDLFLRLIEKTDRIYHISRILYHWRRTATSTAHNIRRKPGALEAGKRALAEHLERTGQPGAVFVDWSTHAYRVRRELVERRRIGIVMRCRREESNADPSERISAKTDYPNYEIISGGAVGTFRIEDADSPWLLFLDSAADPIYASWLTAMAEHVQRPEVGAVGARLSRLDGKVEHAGIVLDCDRIGLNAFRGFPVEDPGTGRQLQITRNYSAVSDACLLTRREVFMQVGGFDATVAPYSDIDFCLKLRRAGYLIVSTPHARLSCEGARRRESNPAAAKIMRERWSDWLENDPYYNQHLSREADFSLGK